MDGLGAWVDKILTVASGVYQAKLGAETAASQSEAQAQIEASKAQSKRWLYLGIGVVGAALLIALTRKAVRA